MRKITTHITSWFRSGSWIAVFIGASWAVVCMALASPLLGGEEPLTLKGHSGPVTCVVFSPDGKRLASSSKTEFDRPLNRPAPGERKVRVNPPGPGELKVWDAASGQEMLTLKGHTGWVMSVAFSADGKRLASAGGASDGTVKVWDSTNGEELHSSKRGGSVSSMAFSPDGKRLASAAHFAGRGTLSDIVVWDATSGQDLLTLKGHSMTGTIVSLAFSPDGTRLVSGSLDKTVKMWDTNSGQEVLTLKGHVGAVISMAFSPDGKRLALCSSPSSRPTDKFSDPSQVKVWDAMSGQETLTLKGHTHFVNCVTFSPDGKRLATAGGINARPPRPGEIKLWDATSGQELLELKGDGDTSRVASVAFSPDGKRLASASDDKTVKVWDVTPRP